MSSNGHINEQKWLNYRREMAGRARKFFSRTDSHLPDGVHLLVGGQTRCQFQVLGPCCFDSSEKAAAEAIAIREEYLDGAGNNVRVTVIAGVCPVCGGAR